jgi:glycosyltransferase involved in cell wall biosynthesis
MGVLHVITGLNVGGAENMLAKLIESGNGDSARLRPQVLSLLTPGKLAERIRARGAPIHSLEMRSSIPTAFAAWRLARIARSVRPDLLHGWMHHGNLAATCASFALRDRPPVIWNVRHSLVDIAYEKPLSRAVLRLGAALSATPAAIIYNSATAARQYEAFGFPGEKTVIIPNGFDCHQFRPRDGAREMLVQAHGIDPAATIVGMVARMHPMKDPENLVEAIGRARRDGHDLHLIMVGTGTDTPSPGLTDALRRALPPSRITLVGERHDVAVWLSGLDILALPSAWGEAFPNILGEAMASGVPCIATDVGDSGWIIGGTGHLVPPRDAAAMAAALAGLAEAGPDTRRKMGEAARARVVASFSLGQIASRYEALYEAVLDHADIHMAAADQPAERVRACAG